MPNRFDKMDLKESLERLSATIDPAHVDRARTLQAAAWDYLALPRIPVLLLNACPPDWPVFPYGETVDCPEKMLLNELMPVYAGALLKDDRILSIRANLGPGVIPSLFGAEWFQIGNQMPAVKPLCSREDVRKVVSAGIPPCDRGFAARVLAFERFFLDALGSHDSLRKSVRVSLSDTQSPLSNALQLWGGDLYAALVEDPALVHSLLDLLTETIIHFAKLQKRAVNEPDGSADHFSYAVPGGIRVVDDVAMNLSPAMYEEFCRPYHERIYAAFSGGYMHYCGHKLKSQRLRLATQGLRGIEMGFDNPERNPDYRLESIWYEAALYNRAILWIRDRLPDSRPEINTGLIYGYRSSGVPWPEAVDRFKRAREFWSN